MDNIFFIVPSLRGGGAERVLTTLANELVAQEYNVNFVFTISDDVEYALDEKIKIIHNFSEGSRLKQIQFIRKVMKDNPGSTFVSFFTFQNLYSIIASAFLNVKIIVSERNDPSRTLYGKNYLNGLRNFLYSRADSVVFQTRDAMMFFNKSVQKKGVIIDNPLRKDLPDIHMDERTKKLVAVGRLNKQKNYPMMLRGVAQFLKDNPDYVLEIYGENSGKDGNLQPTLEALAMECGIANQTVFKGFASNVLEEINDAMLFMNSSIYEGISNSMLEAIAQGIPCLCTDCPIGGARRFVQDGINGKLVKVNDVEMFASAIKDILGDVTYQDNSLAYAEVIRNKLSVKNIVNSWAKLF